MAEHHFLDPFIDVVWLNLLVRCQTYVSFFGLVFARFRFRLLIHSSKHITLLFISPSWMLKKMLSLSLCVLEIVILRILYSTMLDCSIFLTVWVFFSSLSRVFFVLFHFHTVDSLGFCTLLLCVRMLFKAISKEEGGVMRLVVHQTQTISTYWVTQTKLTSKMREKEKRKKKRNEKKIWFNWCVFVAWFRTSICLCVARSNQ